MVLDTVYSISCQNQRASKRFFINVTLCILVLLLLTGCNSASIHQDARYNPPVYFGTHVVHSGETLYSIARRYGRDFSELASANDIGPPYLIRPGQKIDLELVGDGSNSEKDFHESDAKKSVNVTESKQGNDISRTVTKNKKHRNFKDIKWRWPYVGPILAKYTFATIGRKSKLGNKGIDIGGELGDPVYAAASGEVVYAGSGLLGYGNLVIITHDDRYLSAYAHNHKILVTEGQRVKTGDQIAELGSSGTNVPKLHFEIRKDGNPVDPLKYLPSR